jgi:hypothetical protein
LLRIGQREGCTRGMVRVDSRSAGGQLSRGEHGLGTALNEHSTLNVECSPGKTVDHLMKPLPSLLIGLTLLLATAEAQTIRLEPARLEATLATGSIETVMGREAVKVAKDPKITEPDQPSFIKIRSLEFRNGTIEVKVLSRLLPTAPATARGFIGVAFRIAADNSKFECIYLRPTNGRAEDQVRRNHSIQYFSFPDFTFDRLRKESPERYESYADMGLNEWITMRIEVRGKQAKLFLNDTRQPVLIVNDLKHGENAAGAIALWVDNGTEGYFADLKVQPQ